MPGLNLRGGDAMTHSLYGARTAICREKKYLLAALSGSSRSTCAKVKKSGNVISLGIYSRDSREGCIIVAKCAAGYRALMGGRSEK